ncbi:hypothetical protein HMPREF9140_00419 [Prevotella micans F0438]|uniref:Fimbrillin family protein n=3 Tax=Prevotella micans TaxID=189723 RepID=H1Q0I1_9BACT|nr:hypothetical protein HMPREF9140_00419 [Prevotella micans F0438]
MKTYYRSAVVLLGMIAVLSFGACADDEIVDNRQGVKDGLGFSVSDIQDAPEDQTRTLNDNPEDYAVQGIDFTEEAGNACLQETTVPGVNPVKRAPATRSDFQNSIGAPFGAFACKNGSGKPDFFYNEKVAANGTMVSPKTWTSDESTLQFYAVYPYIDGSNPNLQLVQPLAGELPSIDFTTPTDIANQIDLMTASTQDITYTSTGGGSHVVPLTFYHSLTAIRFGVGSNLSWAKTIKSVEFQGVYSKGRYDIKTKTWSNQSATQNYKLDNIGVSTSEAINNVILKDGHTFLMIPQILPAGAKIVVTFSDNTSITAKIEGKKWKPGTTKTYMITEKNSNWNYIIQATSPTAVAYDATQTGNYGITSYRQVGSEKQPVKWRVVKYQESADGGATWSAESDTKPAWLTGLTLTQGDGSTAAQQGTATVQKAPIIDKLAPYNKVLHDATPKGSAGNYYDLSTHDYKGNATARNTANSYLISAPGYYKIPLVYGNAITGGNPNPHAYISQAPTGLPVWEEKNVLRTFKDHAGQDITDPWITQTNSGANIPDGAKIIWTDQSGIVEASSLGIEGSGTNAFVHFRVPHDKIKNGNAVIAVTKGGVVVWSWHLWFDHDDAFDTVECTNFTNHIYKFTNRNLGFANLKWIITTYSAPRVARIKVEQTTGNGSPFVKQFSYITITQNPGSEKIVGPTFYQFGRKDPFPYTDNVMDGSFTKDAGNNMSVSNGILNPDKFYTYGTSWYNDTDHMNLWSSDNITRYTFNIHDDALIVKTIYDPSPVGFHMPPISAFTGFSKTGNNTTVLSDINVSGAWDDGWHFNNKITSSDKTVYFPASGYRDGFSGEVTDIGSKLEYHSALPSGTGGVNVGLGYYYSSPQLRFSGGIVRAEGCPIRPVAE